MTADDINSRRFTALAQRARTLRQDVSFDRIPAAYRALGYDAGVSETPIVPVLFKDEARTLEMTARLDADDIFASPVIYPACARHAPRVRMPLGAEHTLDDMDVVIDAFRRHRA